jgi:hypothetical protein
MVVLVCCLEISHGTGTSSPLHLVLSSTVGSSVVVTIEHRVMTQILYQTENDNTQIIGK